MTGKPDCILIDSYADNSTKLQILSDQISRAKATTTLPIILTSHIPVPDAILKDVDYFIYDRNNALSENYVFSIHFDAQNYCNVKSKRSSPYHALSCYRSIKNGASFCRGKFNYVHFFEYDCLVNFPEYLSLVTPILNFDAKFVGQDYYIEAQNMKGIITNFFSFHTRWMDDFLVEIDNWDEFRNLGKGSGDHLMLENWLWDYFSSWDLINQCRFFHSGEAEHAIINANIEVPNDKEPGVRAYLSETSDHKLILFVHLYGGHGRVLPITINYMGLKETIPLAGGILYWKMFEKFGNISITTECQSKKFYIDPSKEYTDTTFSFADGRIKSLGGYTGYVNNNI